MSGSTEETQRFSASLRCSARRFVQVLPPFCVTCKLPSSVSRPNHQRIFGDSAIE
jgi:hypothetical protein